MKGWEETYTDEEREEVMLGFTLAFVIGGYLILEYSLSFVLPLCKRYSIQCHLDSGSNN